MLCCVLFLFFFDPWRIWSCLLGSRITAGLCYLLPGIKIMLACESDMILLMLSSLRFLDDNWIVFLLVALPTFFHFVCFQFFIGFPFAHHHFSSISWSNLLKVEFSIRLLVRIFHNHVATYCSSVVLPPHWMCYFLAIEKGLVSWKKLKWGGGYVFCCL